MPSPSFRLFTASFAACLSLLSITHAQDEAAPASTDPDVEPERPSVPEDLIDESRLGPEDLRDEVVQNELGVNRFTTPSIDRLFDQLDDFGALDYHDLEHELPETISPDRAQIALTLGTLIADGFAAVQSNNLGDISTLGRSILDHAEALGTGERVRQHSKNLIQHAAEGSRDQLRVALADTQDDVEAEMVELRDTDLVHLISLGGWLRAFQYGCHSVDDPFDPERVRDLARLDVLRYFQAELDFLAERVEEVEKINQVRNGLDDLERLLDRPRTREFTRRDLDELTRFADGLVRTIQEN